jgi:mannose-6-phosphate isomerase-like protein (cupin superfamily)
MTPAPEQTPVDPIPRVPKVWGEEHWIVNRDYCGKKLVLKQGFRCSLHYHQEKDEVFYVIRGRVLLEYGSAERVLLPGDAQRIAPGTVHRFWGLEDSEIIEFSTHHEDSDSYRIEESGAFDAAALAGRNLG